MPVLSKWPKPAECRSYPGSYQTSSDAESRGFSPVNAITTTDARDDILDTLQVLGPPEEEFVVGIVCHPPNPESSGESDPSANQNLLPAHGLRIVLRYVPAKIVHESEAGLGRDVPLLGPLKELMPDLPEGARGGEGQRDRQYQKAHMRKLAPDRCKAGGGGDVVAQAPATPRPSGVLEGMPER